MAKFQKLNSRVSIFYFSNPTLSHFQIPNFSVFQFTHSHFHLSLSKLSHFQILKCFEFFELQYYHIPKLELPNCPKFTFQSINSLVHMNCKIENKSSDLQKQKQFIVRASFSFDCLKLFVYVNS